MSIDPTVIVKKALSLNPGGKVGAEGNAGAKLLKISMSVL